MRMHVKLMCTSTCKSTFLQCDAACEWQYKLLNTHYLLLHPVKKNSSDYSGLLSLQVLSVGLCDRVIIIPQKILLCVAAGFLQHSCRQPLCRARSAQVDKGKHSWVEELCCCVSRCRRCKKVHVILVMFLLLVWHVSVMVMCSVLLTGQLSHPSLRGR